jgi:H+/Cl- antiporter ClcA
MWPRNRHILILALIGLVYAVLHIILFFKIDDLVYLYIGPEKYHTGNLRFWYARQFFYIWAFVIPTVFLIVTSICYCFAERRRGGGLRCARLQRNWNNVILAIIGFVYTYFHIMFYFIIDDLVFWYLGYQEYHAGNTRHVYIGKLFYIWAFIIPLIVLAGTSTWYYWAQKRKGAGLLGWYRFLGLMVLIIICDGIIVWMDYVIGEFWRHIRM